MRKKHKNLNLVAYFEKTEKNVKILQILCQFFDFFCSFFFDSRAKPKKFKKTKKDVFFRFPLKVRGVFTMSHLVK